MKLAEALQERKDLDARIEQLRFRLTSNALVQEGERPAEEPSALQAELDESIERFGRLIAAINLTNCSTRVEYSGESITLTELIAKKDALTLMISVYRDLCAEAGRAAHRARGTEIKIVPTVQVARLQKRLDNMSRALRELDNLLQGSNWATELIIANDK